MTRRHYGLGVAVLGAVWLSLRLFNLIHNWGIRTSSLVEPILPVALIGLGFYCTRMQDTDVRLTWRESATLISILAVPALIVLAFVLLVTWVKF